MNENNYFYRSVASSMIGTTSWESAEKNACKCSTSNKEILKLAACSISLVYIEAQNIVFKKVATEIHLNRWSVMQRER